MADADEGKADVPPGEGALPDEPEIEADTAADTVDSADGATAGTSFAAGAAGTDAAPAPTGDASEGGGAPPVSDAGDVRTADAAVPAGDPAMDPADADTTVAAAGAGVGVGAGAGPGPGVESDTKAAEGQPGESGAPAKRPEVVVELPTASEADLAAYCRLQARAFRDKCSHVGMNDEEAEWVTRLTSEVNWDSLRARCGVVRDERGAIAGACQLKFFNSREVEPENGGSRMCKYLGCCTTLRATKLAVLEGHECSRGEAYVAFIAVAEGNRGKGFGKALMQWADQFAIEQGCTHISLDVSTKNRAIHLYERQGYEVTKQSGCCCWCCCMCLVGHPGFATMVKPLG